MEEIVNNNEVRPIDRLFKDSPDVQVYGFSFDKAAEYLRDVQMKMSRAIGWKDPTQPFDFDRFSGFYPEVYSDHADICHGNYVVARFSAATDGSLAFKPMADEFGMYPDDIKPWYPLGDIMDGKFCLEKENIDAARRECNEGMVIIYGLRYGEDIAFGYNSDDMRVKRALVAENPNIRLVGEETLLNAIGNWINYDCVPGMEHAQRPEIVRFAWDGETLRSEKEVCLFLAQKNGVDEDLQLQRLEHDWDIIKHLRAEGEKVRRELEKAAGIPEGSHFNFTNAVYPSYGLRDDALFLTDKCGRHITNFITSAGGQITYNREYDADRMLSAPEKSFSSVNEAMDTVRKAILNPKNIEAAKMDYQRYVQSQKQTDKVSSGIKR